MTHITMDSPQGQEWKVSVCLNPHQRVLGVEAGNPNHGGTLLAFRLGEYAKRLQVAVNGEVNFIDIYRTRQDQLVVSEINTACNLAIHTRLTGFDFAQAIADYVSIVVFDRTHPQGARSA